MTNTEIAEYIGQLTQELARLARGNGLERLNLICMMAADEAAVIKTGRAGANKGSDPR